MHRSQAYLFLVATQQTIGINRAFWRFPGRLNKSMDLLAEVSACIHGVFEYLFGGATCYKEGETSACIHSNHEALRLCLSDFCSGSGGAVVCPCEVVGSASPR